MGRTNIANGRSTQIESTSVGYFVQNTQDTPIQSESSKVSTDRPNDGGIPKVLGQCSRCRRLVVGNELSQIGPQSAELGDCGSGDLVFGHFGLGTNQTDAGIQKCQGTLAISQGCSTNVPFGR